MSLRARLVVALLALAILPTAVFTLFTLVELDRATRRWYRPGVDHALESAQQVTRTALTRMEATTLAQAEVWARSVPPARLDPPDRARVREGLRASGLDFFQLYRHEGGRWERIDQVLPAGVIEVRGADLSDQLDAALASDHLLRSPGGALAATARVDARHALAVGMWVPPDFFAEADRITEGRSAYSRLGVMVDVQRPFTWLLVAALVILLTAAALLLAQALARPIARPLSELSAALNRVASGDLSVRVPPRGAREMRVLGAAFNTMTARLAEARAALAQAEREAAWREVARRVAHEIKNPLTALRYALHRVQRRATLVPEAERAAVQESLDAMLLELENLATMAEQFSQYARLPEPLLEPLDLTEVARTAAALHEPGAVRIDIGGGALPVRGDRLMLSRALHNLVINAREAGRDAPIEIRARAEGSRAVVEVLDRGPGLPPGQEGRIFDAYVSTKNRGSGLGLSLVRDIVRQHGGEVTLENREGGGACARLTLPLDQEDGREAGTP